MNLPGRSEYFKRAVYLLRFVRVVPALHNVEADRTVRRKRTGVWVFRNTSDDRGDQMTFQGKVLGILMLTSTLPLGAGAAEPLSMKVSPAVSFAPANLMVRARIEADAGNRAVEVIAESADFYRSSQVQLEGDKAPLTTQFEFRSLPPGTYEVRALLIGVGGQQRAFARQQVNVVALGGPGGD